MITIWTMIGQSLTFFVFVWFCMSFVWPPIRKAMDGRTKRIADGLSAAERAARDLELAHEKVSHQLKDAKVEAARIIEDAKRRAAQVVEGGDPGGEERAVGAVGDQRHQGGDDDEIKRGHG